MDAGEPAMTSSAVVMVTVDDVNDNSAVFTEFTYQFSVPESSPVGVVVGTVTAVDTDRLRAVSQSSRRCSGYCDSRGH